MAAVVPEEVISAPKEISSRLPFEIFVKKRNISSHGLTDLQNAGPGRIDSHVFQKNLAVWSEQPCCNKISGRRNISGYGDITGFQKRLRTDGGGSP